MQFFSKSSGVSAKEERKQHIQEHLFHIKWRFVPQYDYPPEMHLFFAGGDTEDSNYS